MSQNVSQVKKSLLKDVALAIGLVLALLIVIYVTPKTSFNFFNLALLAMLLVPTVIALLKGAPFVPTPMIAVEKMLELAKIEKGQKIYDIGCGDGRMVYLAAQKYGANAVGLELSPLVYILAKIRKLFWRSKAKIVFGDFRYKNLTDADVIVCYLLPGPLAKLQLKLQKELKKGTKVISYAFRIGDLEPKFVTERDKVNNIAPIWVYEF